MVLQGWRNLRVLEAQVQAITTDKHRRESELIEKLLSAYMAGFGKLGTFTLSADNKLEYAWLLLAARSFNSLICAFDLLQKGYYSEAFMPIRSVFEDWLTAKDSEGNPKTLDALLKGDDKFWRGEGRYSQMASRLSDKLPNAWKEIYGQVSTIVHARQQALMILIDPQTKELRLGSDYNDLLFLGTYQALLGAASIVQELLYKLLGDNGIQWWEETLPMLQEAKADIERIGKELDKPS